MAEIFQKYDAEQGITTLNLSETNQSFWQHSSIFA